MLLFYVARGQVQSTTIHFADSAGSPFSKLFWSPPEQDNEGQLIGYIIEYRNFNSQEWKRLNQYLVPGPACLVDGLIPVGDYQFRVTSVFKDPDESAISARTDNAAAASDNVIPEDESRKGQPSDPSLSK